MQGNLAGTLKLRVTCIEKAETLFSSVLMQSPRQLHPLKRKRVRGRSAPFRGRLVQMQQLTCRLGMTLTACVSDQVSKCNVSVTLSEGASVSECECD